MITVPATAELVPFLLCRIGSERRAMLNALLDGGAEAEIARGIRRSTLSYAGIDADGVVTMGGVVPIPGHPGYGYVWQYATAIEHNKRAYIEQGRTILRRMLEQYEHLSTIIEPDYPAALRHIRRLGFSVAPPVDFFGKLGCLCERSR